MQLHQKIINGALSLDDLWDGLLAYGRFRWKTYLTASKSYAKDQKIKPGKLKKLSDMLSPAEPLGIKGYPKMVANGQRP